jgi:hypothetical protein
MMAPRWEALHSVAVPRCLLVWALFRWELVGVVVWTFVGPSGPYASR